MQQLGQSTEESEEMQESETEADVQTESLALPEAKITTFKDAIIALESFLESPWHFNDVPVVPPNNGSHYNTRTILFATARSQIPPPQALINYSLYFYDFIFCLL